MTRVLAIDQGTTNTKAVLVAADGSVTSTGVAGVSVQHPAPGHVEQDAEELWASVVRAVGSCLDQAPDVAVTALVLSTQRESVLAWDRREGRPLGPVVGWQDERTAAWCRDRVSEAEEELVRSRTGLRVDPMFSAPKIAWLLAQPPASDLSRVCVGTVDSWLLWRLTGGARHVTEAGNASRTLLYDVAGLGWSAELLDVFGVPLEVLPQVLRSDGDFGVTRDVPGLPDGVPVLAVLADSHAALLGQGCTVPGRLKATYGTGTSVMTPAPGLATDDSGVSSTLAWLTEAPTYAREGNILASGAALAWTGRLLGLDVPALLELAASVPDSGGVTLLPSFTGLGAPHWRRGLRAAITQLDAGSGRAQVARAAVDAVAQQVCDVVEVVDADVPVGTVRADGGATASQLLMQSQADLLGCPVEVADVPEVSAYGAAVLGWRRLGVELPVRRSRRTFVPQITEEARRERRGRWQQEVRRLTSAAGS